VRPLFQKSKGGKARVKGGKAPLGSPSDPPMLQPDLSHLAGWSVAAPTKDNIMHSNSSTTVVPSEAIQ